MLLHYLENFPAEKLGLTGQEVAHVLSSIYEARISWTDFKSSGMAKSNWGRYGEVSHSLSREKGSQLFEKNKHRCEKPFGQRINFAFQDVVMKGQGVVLNLQDKAHQFSRKASVAFHFSDPQRIKRKRILYQLSKFGLGFVPLLPDLVVDRVENFLDSLYEEQALTEGALAGHFASLGQNENKNVVLRQALNPFLMW